MKSEKFIQHILCPTILILCSIGFIVQVSNVTSRYIEYNTRTKVNMIITTSLSSLPSVSACLSIDDAVQLKSDPPVVVTKSYTTKWNKMIISSGRPYIALSEPPTDAECDTERRRRTLPDRKSLINNRKLMIRNMTLKQLFTATPNIEELIFGCRIRDAKSFVLNILEKHQCLNVFNIRKYFEREHVCYDFIPKYDNQTYDMIKYTMSPSFVGEMYRIFFVKEYSKCLGSLSFSVHVNGSSHILDSAFASNHYHRIGLYPAPRIFYREVETFQLASPYTTKCVDMKQTGYEHSLDIVNKEMIKHHNFVIPFIPTYNESYDIRLLQEYDMENTNISRSFNHLLNKYKTPNACHHKFAATTADVLGDKIFFMSIFWPANEKLWLKYVPDQELIDFIVYIGSCIGVWFGLSAYSVIDMTKFVIDMRGKILNKKKVHPSDADRRLIVSNVPNPNRAHILTNRRIDSLFRILNRHLIDTKDMQQKIDNQSASLEKFQNMINLKIDLIDEKMNQK